MDIQFYLGLIHFICLFKELCFYFLNESEKLTIVNISQQPSVINIPN